MVAGLEMSNTTAGAGAEMDYIHQELNQAVTAIGGHYVLVKEIRLPFHGRQILYLVGHAAFDTTCCGAGGCAYALVPGFVLQWQYTTNEDGLVTSLVEPIRDKSVQEQLQRLIEQKEVVGQVSFWGGAWLDEPEPAGLLDLPLALRDL